MERGNKTFARLPPPRGHDSYEHGGRVGEGRRQSCQRCVPRRRLCFGRWLAQDATMCALCGGAVRQQSAQMLLRAAGARCAGFGVACAPSHILGSARPTPESKYVHCMSITMPSSRKSDAELGNTRITSMPTIVGHGTNDELTPESDLWERRRRISGKRASAKLFPTTRVAPRRTASPPTSRLDRECPQISGHLRSLSPATCEHTHTPPGEDAGALRHGATRSLMSASLTCITMSSKPQTTPETHE